MTRDTSKSGNVSKSEERVLIDSPSEHHQPASFVSDGGELLGRRISDGDEPAAPQQQQQQRRHSNTSCKAESSSSSVLLLSSPTMTTTSASSASSVPSSSTSTNVASLIQSAAKVSILDNKNNKNTKNKNKKESSKKKRESLREVEGGEGTEDDKNGGRLFEDDEYDASSPSQYSHSLKTLQRKTLPVMPDEQDRKRFVGCLAAVLASLYDYEEQASSTTTNDADVGSYEDAGRAKKDDDDDDDLNASSFYEEEEEEEEEYYDDEDTSESFQHSERLVNSNATDQSVSYSQQPQHQQQYRRASSSSSQLPPRDHRRQSSAKNSRRLTQQQRQQQRQPKKNKRARAAATTTAQRRFRQRRYAVYSNFLASSAQMLQLDETQSKCFVPMLAKLLAPNNNNNNNNNTDRSRNRNRTSRTGAQQQSSSSSSVVNKQQSATAARDAYLNTKMEEIDHLRPFLELLSPGAGLRCLAMFLLQHLLHSAKGYDARIRHAVKTLGVLLLLHDDLLLEEEDDDDDVDDTPKQDHAAVGNEADVDVVTLATRKFESLEQFIAAKLIELSKAQQQQQQRGRRGLHRNNNSGRATSSSSSGNNQLTSRETTKTSSRDKIMRGLKIGGTAVAAGTLFAITGGLAAPGIAAGVAAIAGTTAVATAAAVLTSTAAVTTIFGVGGGGLVAYKMQRRTIGLTEFEFCKESSTKGPSEQDDNTPDAELFSTICLSGWLRDDCDFQRPWGVAPSRPPITDRLELLERFYCVVKPDHVHKSAQILASWKGEVEQLWDLLRQTYGRDPDHVFPLEHGPRFTGALTLEQQEVVEQLFTSLGCTISPAGIQSEHARRQQTPFERMRLEQKNVDAVRSRRETGAGRSLLDSIHGPHFDEVDAMEAVSGVSSEFDSSTLTESGDQEKKSEMPKHLATVWDYQATFGGELYTVRWETSLLEELCDSVADLAADVVTGATTTLLKYTALSTLVAAMAIPVALKSAANLIDGTWTLVVERADEAGKELAKSLLFSSAGNRPVNLVGFSFGARAIYSCLKELARYQEKWEDYQESRKQLSSGLKRDKKGKETGIEEHDVSFENMREPSSIVESAILMGLPNHLSLSSWKACRQVVAGRLVNCFSRKDLILSLMFQFKKIGLKPVCGTCPVRVDGVENIDVTDLVSGHQDYCLITGKILQRVRLGQPFRSKDLSFIESNYSDEDDLL